LLTDRFAHLAAAQHLLEHVRIEIMDHLLDRRQLIRGAGLIGGGAAMSAWIPAWAQPASTGKATPLQMVSGDDIALRIARQTMTIDGRLFRAIGINGTVPGPLIRLREGQNVKLKVENALDVDSSIHWHGMLVPAQFDGVPGISFPGIPPRSTFLYEFPIRQAGTYWYHSHSGAQEQLGLYGPIVIDPAGQDPIRSEREHVVVLSDQSQADPETIFRRMKVDPSYYNRQEQTLSGAFEHRDQLFKDRLRWGKKRMDATDIADVTGQAYTYLINGHGPVDNWTALFAPGDRVRLRIINASSMTTFNVRFPELPMTIVQADGQNVRPVETDEFQIGVAETYDVVVTPPDARAYTLIGESVDRSGFARATLAPRLGMTASVPPLRPRPLATMQDMGMGGMAMGSAKAVQRIDPTAEQNASARLATDPRSTPAPSTSAHAPMPAMDTASMASMGHGSMGGMPTAGMDMHIRDFTHAPEVTRGPGVRMIAPMPVDRTGEPGQGLTDVGHRVLVYRDLVSAERNPDVRAPSRSIDIHITGNMERFMWAFDGVKMSDTMDPFPFIEGERVRVTLINDSMMAHPIHLHGHFFELVTGHGDHAPRKHTVMVQPGGKATFDLTANAVGDWAFHCHLLYHMMAGLMRVVSVRPKGEAA
jgi:CopA family copper-resistance protein